MKNEYPIVNFKDPSAWRKWLSINHATVDGVWLQIYKKDCAVKTVSYSEALDEALCFGWIDGQKKTYDDASFLQKFTPRRRRSLWSQRNVEHVSRLSAEGKIRPPGLAEIEAAKQDGRWDQAYASQATMSLPEDFIKKVQKNKKAYTRFKILSKGELYSIYFKLQTAKSVESREKRMISIISFLEHQK